MLGRLRQSRMAGASRGFTLIEMLVVVAIIAILIALLVPVLSLARRKSRETATLANIKNIRMALDDYYTEWNGVFPQMPGVAGNIFDAGAGVAPGFYNTAGLAAQGSISSGAEDNSALIAILMSTKHLQPNNSNLKVISPSTLPSFMDYFNNPIICRFMVIPCVNSTGTVISDKLAQRAYIWSYGADRTNWINATSTYTNLGLPNYDGQSPATYPGGLGEVGNMEAVPLARDDNLTNWR